MAGVGVDVAGVRLGRLLELILGAAVEVIGFDAATVTARHADGVASTVAATNQRVMAMDDAQYASGEGPCLAVLDFSDPIYLEDAAGVDERWEGFSRQAAEMGVCSTLSVHVPTDVAELAASLNLYSRKRLELSEKQVRAAGQYAEALAVALVSVDAYKSAAKLSHDLAEAMRSRAVIEQAKGMLMAEHRISEQQAFSRLREVSQNANMKLRDVAQRLVDARTQPKER